jgi:hypothetical protein
LYIFISVKLHKEITSNTTINLVEAQKGLLQMYSLCKNAEGLNATIDELQKKLKPEELNYTEMINAYSEVGNHIEAIKLVKQGITKTNLAIHDAIVYLKACAAAKDLKMGKQVHVALTKIENDLTSFAAVKKYLVEMYKACGDKKNAENVSQVLEKQIAEFKARHAAFDAANPYKKRASTPPRFPLQRRKQILSFQAKKGLGDKVWGKFVPPSHLDQKLEETAKQANL